MTAGEVLAVVAGAGLTRTRSFAIVVAPAYPPTARRAAWKPSRIVGIPRPLYLGIPAQQREAHQGGGGEDEAYREDDQRRFWDTVVQVCVRVCRKRNTQQQLVVCPGLLVGRQQPRLTLTGQLWHITRMAV